MEKVFFIAMGGAIGAVLRYFIAGWGYHFFSSEFPWGTLIVNLTGSLVIGFLWGMFETSVVSQNLRLFLFMGLLGAFTTFSTFTFESFGLIRDGEYFYLLMNVALSVVFGICLVFAGYLSARFLINSLR